MTPYLPDTVVQRTRAFLRETGMDAPPWLGAREVVDRVADLFVERRAMDGDRARLRSFLEGLAAHARDRRAGARLAAVDAEVMRPDEVAEVIESLSRTLTEGDRRTAIDGLLQALNAPAVCALLLLGIAAGCDQDGGSPRDVPADTHEALGADADPHEALGADTDPHEATETEVLQLLDGYIDGSGLPAAEKSALKDCVRSRFVTPERAGLADTFATMTPDQIAAYLESMLQPAGKCYTEPTGDVVENPGPDPDPAYKGVSF
jgi:hypothetical protein